MEYHKRICYKLPPLFRKLENHISAQGHSALQLVHYLKLPLFLIFGVFMFYGIYTIFYFNNILTWYWILQNNKKILRWIFKYAQTMKLSVRILVWCRSIVLKEISKANPSWSSNKEPTMQVLLNEQLFCCLQTFKNKCLQKHKCGNL